jgi:Enoyl-CoA hydratase/isomerase
MSTKTDELVYEVKDKIATITLNRPDKMNAFTGPMIDAWAGSLQEAQRDPDVNVVIVTGSGKAFCSGGDVARMGDGRPSPLDHKNGLWENIHRVPKALEAMDKPVIAMVNGVAVGAGMGMCVMCDMRVAADTARFSTGYVRVGLVPGDGELHRGAGGAQPRHRQPRGACRRAAGGHLCAGRPDRERPAGADPNDQEIGLPVDATGSPDPSRPGVLAHGGGARDVGPQGRRAGVQGQAEAQLHRAVRR